MIRLFFTTLVFLFCLSATIKGQISILLYEEDFNRNFQLSNDTCSKEACIVEFLPGLFGNEVGEKSRIYRDTSNYSSSDASLAMVPTSSFSPEVILRLKVPGWKDLQLSLLAKGGKNGNETATRSSTLSISYSINEGSSYSKETVVDTFDNISVDEFRKIPFLFTNTLSWPDIWIKLKVRRVTSEGEGTAAKVFIDDLKAEETVSLTSVSEERNLSHIYLSTINGRKLLLTGSVITGIIMTGEGKEIIKFHKSSEVEVQQLSKGIYYCKTEEGLVKKFMID